MRQSYRDYEEHCIEINGYGILKRAWIFIHDRNHFDVNVGGRDFGFNNTINQSEMEGKISVSVDGSEWVINWTYSTIDKVGNQKFYTPSIGVFTKGQRKKIVDAVELIVKQWVPANQHLFNAAEVEKQQDEIEELNRKREQLAKQLREAERAIASKQELIQELQSTKEDKGSDDDDDQNSGGTAEIKVIPVNTVNPTTRKELRETLKFFREKKVQLTCKLTATTKILKAEFERIQAYLYTQYAIA